MTDNERLELQMIDYSNRLMEASRAALWRQCQARREEQAREAIRREPTWPKENARHRPGLREALELLAVLVFSCMAGASAAFGVWKLFN
jgi:hypothetical protein